MPEIRYHADDYGITAKQAKEILNLDALRSVSIFCNSPEFDECAELARPKVESGDWIIRPHINLVEGHPCSDPAEVPLLVNERGTFCNDFTGLMKLASKAEFNQQVFIECRAQIERFVGAFPNMGNKLEIDSHQHTHMIPAVFDAILSAAIDLGYQISYIRAPVEPWSAHVGGGHVGRIVSLNTAKNLLLSHYAKVNAPKTPAASTSNVFSGIVLSGHMEDLDDRTIERLAAVADKRGGMLEVLFHPVSMKAERCLDPENAAFTEACCSPHRDAEAERLREIAARNAVAG